jgi:CheY-like chemotaxis protein
MKRIYLIETHGRFVKDLKEVVNADAIELQVFTSGSDFSRVLETTVPDLFIISLDLEDDKGYAICKLLLKNEKTASIPIVLTSSSGRDAVNPEHLIADNIKILKKPTSKKEIAEVLFHFFGEDAIRASDESATYSFEKFFDDIFSDIEEGPGKKDKKADSAYHITVDMSKNLPGRKNADLPPATAPKKKETGERPVDIPPKKTSGERPIVTPLSRENSGEAILNKEAEVQPAGYQKKSTAERPIVTTKSDTGVRPVVINTKDTLEIDYNSDLELSALDLVPQNDSGLSLAATSVEIVELRKSLEEATISNLEKDSEIAERDAIIHKHLIEIENQKNEIAELSRVIKEYSALNEELNLLNAEKEKWINENDIKNREIQKLKSELHAKDELINNTGTQMIARERELQEKLSATQEELNDSQYALMKKEAEWNNVGISFQDQLRELSASIQEKENNLNQLRMEMDHLFLEKSALESEKENIKKNLDLAIMRLESELATLGQEKSEKEIALNSVIARMAAELEATKTQHGLASEKLERIVKTLKDAVNIVSEKKIVEDNIEF